MEFLPTRRVGGVACNYLSSELVPKAKTSKTVTEPPSSCLVPGDVGDTDPVCLSKKAEPALTCTKV